MSEQARASFIEQTRNTGSDGFKGKSVAEVRKMVDEYYQGLAERARTRYPVDIRELKIAGVRTDVVTPKDDSAKTNKERVLINLHGGGFVVGAGLGGLVESIPIASVGKVKVISVDYRMAPEHRFPAASEDVAAVYRDLLKQYRPESIGIYGCSAGGILSAMVAAWFQKEKLPAPGAIGVFGAGAYGSFYGPPDAAGTWGGDSRYTAPPLTGETPPRLNASMDLPADFDAYLRQANLADPLVSPALSPAALSKFPPTLLISGTRAWDMSAAAQTQRELTKAGVEADLHLWDGMGHCFFFDTDLPESQEAFAVIARFFARHLSV